MPRCHQRSQSADPSAIMTVTNSAVVVIMSDCKKVPTDGGV